MDQVEPAVLVAPADVLFGNVVAAPTHAGPDARDMQFGTGESHVPDAQFEPLRGRFGQQTRDRVRAERGLERVIEPFGEGPLQEPAALMPRGAVGLDLTQARIGCHQRAGRLVRVVVFAAEAAQGRAADTALTGAVHSGEDVKARRPAGAAASNGACART